MLKVDSLVTSVVVYDQAYEQQKQHPPFNSNVTTPYCQLGNETLNAHVPWLSVLFEVLSTGRFTLTELCADIQVNKDVLLRILDNDLSLLTFKIGARLLALHESIWLTIEAAEEENL